MKFFCFIFLMPISIFAQTNVCYISNSSIEAFASSSGSVIFSDSLGINLSFFNYSGNMLSKAGSDYNPDVLNYNLGTDAGSPFCSIYLIPTTESEEYLNYTTPSGGGGFVFEYGKYYQVNLDSTISEYVAPVVNVVGLTNVYVMNDTLHPVPVEVGTIAGAVDWFTSGLEYGSGLAALLFGFITVRRALSLGDSWD